ncbi:hypothetical protein PENTCL1PPCAC_2545, partial [Pristionchus entomophagus]
MKNHIGTDRILKKKSMGVPYLAQVVTCFWQSSRFVRFFFSVLFIQLFQYFPLSVLSTMSTAPRRSLRLRNGNLAEKEKEEPEVKVKTGAPKHRAAVTAASAAERENAAASKAPLKKKAKDEVKEEKGDEEMRDEEEKEEDGGSDEDMEEEKPIKNGQRSPKKNSETASAAEGTRPKRRCSLAATQAFKEMASADGPSDDEDFDIEKEIKKKRNEQKELIEQASTSVSKEKKEKVERRKKRNEQKELTENASMEIKEKKVKYAVGKVAAKKKRGKKVEMEEDTETEKEEDNEEEKSVKKETKKAGDSSSRGPKLQRPPSLDRPSEKVRLLMDKEYNVDRDEMIAWEKRSVHMARELRTLESSFEHQSGRQKEVNTRVQEFVQRCLKDRRCEMGLSEAVRQCNILQGEFDEWERKKKMTITQRIKEQVENEKKERDAEDSDESKEEEDEWEDMETVDGEGEVKTMQVHVENQKTVDNKTLWYSKWLKQEVNRAMRTRCENTHKAHLLSYVAHLRHLAAMALSPSSKDGEIPLSAIALSMIPSKGKKKKNREKEREDLIEWWRKKFEKEEDTEEEEDDRSEEMRVSERMMKRRYTNHKEAALMLFSLLAADGFTVRIVSRCKVITKKVPESAETKKKEEKKEAGKRKKKESSVEPRDYPSIDYWIEVWDEAKEQWKPISAIRTEKDEDDEDEEWGFLVEPLNSCMEKDGRVLYMLAIDNAFAIRDVSARYIHSQDFVSKEFRNRRAGHEWLNELWEMDPWRAHSIRSSKEDDEWLTSMKVEMPKTVGQYKDHPLYVLDKDVLKQQRIFPYDVPSLGEIRGYKIYSRKFVRPTHPAKWYEKM